jgi:hypothetical protein
MEMNPVRSSALAEVGYDGHSHLLYIRFRHNPVTYTFVRVPQSVYDGLMSARSLGSFYNRHIRDIYVCPQKDW